MTTTTTLSDKATAWCRTIAEMANKRIFKVKTLTNVTSDLSSLKFSILPKIYHRKRISHSIDGTILLHPEFFDDKGNIVQKLPKEKRDELKAAIFKEMAIFVASKINLNFYKIMVRCPWAGPRVEGAKGSKTEASKELAANKTKKALNKRIIKEVPTGLLEDVNMWSLTEGKHVLVKNAEIFVANGKIKIARGVYNGKKLRQMLAGGAELAVELKL